MSSNRSFWKAVHSLAHPVSIAAILLLLINDHWLRIQHPSWLTGKLGDFTWLVFAPFIAAMLFAWIVPRRYPQHERIVGVFSFAFIGIWFTTAKTIPLIHQWTTDAVEAIIGWEGTLRMDVTDLLTLPALLIGWWVWQRADHKAISLRPLAYVALALGLLGTLASSDSPYRAYYYTDLGISYICEQDGQLITTTTVGGSYSYNATTSEQDLTVHTNIFTSLDGGLTWKAKVHTASKDFSVECDSSEIVIDPVNTDIQYRWKSGERIERSNDGGQTWLLEYDLFELRQDVRIHYNHRDTSYRRYIPSPLDGIIDSKTGNIVLAMSQDGVLVRTSDGQWQWVSVGDAYQLANIYGISKIFDVLGFAPWLAGALIFLIITSSVAYIRQKVIIMRKAFLFIGWLGWAFIMFFLALEDQSARILAGLIALPLLIFVAIPLSLNAVWDMTRNYRYVWKPVGLVAIGNGLMFILPFFLWSQGTIPLYRTAHLFSLMTAGLAMYAGYVYLRPRLPVLEPDKRKREEKEKATETINA